MLVGHVKELTRYPVKSFQGENVNASQVMDYGLYGDRSHAFLDKSRTNKFLTITQCPQMVMYRAKFQGEEKLEGFPPVHISTPDRKEMKWGDPQLKNELEMLSKRPLEWIRYPPQHVPLGAIEEAPILLITDASLSSLSTLWGEEADGRRFRPNLVIDLINKEPFCEETWIDKSILIGDTVELKISQACQRCMIINVNPDNASITPALLKTIAKERNMQFGMYASVVKTGKIKVGDEISIKG
ncbi:MOSC domain-containing protein [Jeotgalibacillus proteolyticus]|uniref:MOSC domain-containing protein n=1 Tax=Jeotgalibacillus proteolyticus TaxID=2082395 RepID=A0A2S5GCU3_9BACL|nr:MOSC domain-containing protein [Jeotgalibacillus proteolyticus]PPA70731.1 MOSC domain-containing protein [Jeotgalibacillus proteolyticus]